MAWIEQVNRREQKAKHFYDADTGKYRAEFTIHDRHYHTGLAWEDVDESLVDDTGAFDKKCDKTRHQFRISGGGAYRWYPRRNVTTEYVDITEIQYYSNRWRTLNLPAAVWKQQAAEWDMTNLYASITNTWRRVKTEFVLKNSSAYTRLRFAVAFTGLTYNHDTGEITSTTDGLVWGSIDKPTAVDANEAPVTVTATYADGWIEWQAITTGATYPITVDPTFTDGYGGDATTYIDTFLVEPYPDNTAAASIELRNIYITDNRQPSLLKFTLSSLSGATIASANLYLYTLDTYPTGNTGNIVRRILSGNQYWTEANATWNYQDGSGGGHRWAGDTGSDGGSDAGCSVSGTDYSSSALGAYTYTAWTAQYAEKNLSLDTTEFSSMVSANYGMILTSTNAGNHTFCSSDHATTGYRPKLVVEYTTSAESSSVSPSLSPSESLSPSASASPSRSESPSVSPSESLSPSSSESPSISPSSSESPSISPSSSESPSISPSASLSPSASESLSLSPSASESPSISPSSSESPSISPSSSESPSLSPSSSESPSLSPSTSASPSISPSASLSPSASASLSLSPSASESPSLSPSSSASGSLSPSASESPSISPSASLSPSGSASLSLSPSASESPSISPSASASGSLSPSASISPSASASGSLSPSASASGSISPSASASLSLSPSASLSPSSSESASPSPSEAAYLVDLTLLTRAVTFTILTRALTLSVMRRSVYLTVEAK
jgi:hypothetical protein